MAKLSELQRRWIVEFVRCGNQTEAARRAGYSKAGACQAGWRNYKNKEIMEAVRAQLEELKNQSIAGAEEILQYLTSVLRGESRSEIVMLRGAGEDNEVLKLYKAPDEKEKLKAAELLAKRYGLLTENITIGDAPKVIDDV